MSGYVTPNSDAAQDENYAREKAALDRKKAALIREMAAMDKTYAAMEKELAALDIKDAREKPGKVAVDSFDESEENGKVAARTAVVVEIASDSKSDEDAALLKKQAREKAREKAALAKKYTREDAALDAALADKQREIAAMDDKLAEKYARDKAAMDEKLAEKYEKYAKIYAREYAREIAALDEKQAREIAAMDDKLAEKYARDKAPPVQSPDEIPTDLRLVETTTERAQSKPVAHQIPSPESLQPKRTKVVATTRDPARRSTTSSSSGGERSLAERHQSIPSNHFSASATADHPGLDSFWRWWDIEASLFRVYCRGRKDGVPVVPPYNPSSRRGLVKVNLQVTNRTSTEIDVFWVDYKGKEVNKGSIRANSGQWYQTTWIEHPWVFRRRPDGQILLHYIPYRIIPTTSNAPTVDPDDPRVGIHRFTIQNETVDSPFWCHVDDPILPYPAKDMLTNFDKAVACTLEHCQRMGVMSLHILRKYLSNIIQNPEESKYRRIRIANTTFSQNVWLTPARGLLLAAGFVENQGSAELGSAEPLRRERVQEVSRLVYYLERWQEETSADGDAANSPQPLGADGFGRAGYGRVG